MSLEHHEILDGWNDSMSRASSRAKELADIYNNPTLNLESRLKTKKLLVGISKQLDEIRRQGNIMGQQRERTYLESIKSIEDYDKNTGMDKNG